MHHRSDVEVSSAHCNKLSDTDLQVCSTSQPRSFVTFRPVNTGTRIATNPFCRQLLRNSDSLVESQHQLSSSGAASYGIERKSFPSSCDTNFNSATSCTSDQGAGKDEDQYVEIEADCFEQELSIQQKDDLSSVEKWLKERDCDAPKRLVETCTKIPEISVTSQVTPTQVVRPKTVWNKPHNDSCTSAPNQQLNLSKDSAQSSNTDHPVQFLNHEVFIKQNDSFEADEISQSFHPSLIKKAIETEILTSGNYQGAVFEDYHASSRLGLSHDGSANHVDHVEQEAKILLEDRHKKQNKDLSSLQADYCLKVIPWIDCNLSGGNNRKNQEVEEAVSGCKQEEHRNETSSSLLTPAEPMSSSAEHTGSLESRQGLSRINNSFESQMFRSETPPPEIELQSVQPVPPPPVSCHMPGCILATYILPGLKIPGEDPCPSTVLIHNHEHKLMKPQPCLLSQKNNNQLRKHQIDKPVRVIPFFDEKMLNVFNPAASISQGSSGAKIPEANQVKQRNFEGTPRTNSYNLQVLDCEKKLDLDGIATNLTDRIFAASKRDSISSQLSLATFTTMTVECINYAENRFDTESTSLSSQGGHRKYFVTPLDDLTDILGTESVDNDSLNDGESWYNGYYRLKPNLSTEDNLKTGNSNHNSKIPAKEFDNIFIKTEAQQISLTCIDTSLTSTINCLTGDSALYHGLINQPQVDRHHEYSATCRNSKSNLSCSNIAQNSQENSQSSTDTDLSNCQQNTCTKNPSQDDHFTICENACHELGIFQNEEDQLLAEKCSDFPISCRKPIVEPKHFYLSELQFRLQSSIKLTNHLLASTVKSTEIQQQEPAKVQYMCNLPVAD